ncbi:MAG: M23 family metallopeptidase [Sphingorhabdus sp.]|uniref:M23 family metallopeptidase n=1 Tax=Sphingorhabdus sp. TaxID=1902408 RepID=UPI003CC32ED9
MNLSRTSVTLLAFAAVMNCTATPPKAAAPQASRPAIVAPPVASSSVENGAGQSLRKSFWLARDPVQGSAIVARAPSATTAVFFNGAPVALTPDGFFLIGFDRDAENSASLVATLADGQRVEQYVPVKPGNWQIQHVNANPLGGAKTTAEFLARRGPELARINAARAIKVMSDGWRQDFVWPLQGRISGRFGAQRIYNGSPGSYHSGLDIAMPTGTAFVAPADGVVVLAAKDAFTLEGHLLMIDHGMGLNSAFLHCSELLVEEGQSVRQGQVIGKVGATGRASGPHLHWGMKWNAARVDPLNLLTSN